MPFSWIELHGALTHFPIAFLLAVFAFDIGALIFKKPEWRIVSFWLLVGAVVMCVPSLLTGWLYSHNTYSGHAPVQFQAHWIAALTSSILALLLLIWRIAAKDALPNGARIAAAISIVIVAGFISYTGFLGGRMVFGGMDTGSDNSEPSPIPSPSPAVAVLPVPAGNTTQAPNPAPVSQPTAGPTSLNVLIRATPTPRPVAPVAGKPTPTPVAKTTSAPTPPPAAPTPAPAVDPLVAQGRKLVFDNHCNSCHLVEGKGARQAPDLTHEGARNADLNWQIEHLKDPQKMRPGSGMPAFGDLPADQLKAMAAYLVSLH